MPPDHGDIPVGQWDDPFAVVLGQAEDEGRSELLHLPADPDDLFRVQVEVFFGQAEQFAFAHAERCCQLGYGPEFVGVRVGQGEDDGIVPDLDIRCLMGRDLNHG